jgi:MoxR-like ATPase
MTYPYYTSAPTDIAGRSDHTVAGPDDPAGYRPDAGLADAVNVALLLRRPLLVTGEPGTGKTQLAYSVAWQLASRKLLNVASSRVEKYETKSSSVSRELFYSFDTLRRFQAAQTGGSPNNVDYITFNALGRAILNALPREQLNGLVTDDFQRSEPTRAVVLIDEIDKAPRDFPNDLLNEIEEMYFRIPELNNVQVGGGAALTEEYKPIVIITSNSERNLPEPFLRRCIYYDIPFPGEGELKEILLSRVPRLGRKHSPIMEDATRFFFKLRTENIARRKISPAELIQWLTYLLARGARQDAPLGEARELAFAGLAALTKDPTDQGRVRTELESFLGAR